MDGIRTRLDGLAATHRTVVVGIKGRFLEIAGGVKDELPVSYRTLLQTLKIDGFVR